MSRRSSTINNIKYGFLLQLLTQLIGFVNRSLFIHFLGKEYLGVSGLFSSVLSILSLAELGIGSAIVFNLYKPLAENDEKKISQYMNFYKAAYRIVGISILLLGLVTLPFIQHLISDTLEVGNVYVIYFLFLLNTVSSYFFSYKRSLVIADQKEYINSINKQIFVFVHLIVDSVVLIFTQNYYLYLSLRIVVTLLSNIAISIKVNRLYPFMGDYSNSKLSTEEIGSVRSHIKAMFMHSIGSVAVLSTTNLVISVFVSTIIVGLYSNYILITGILAMILTVIFNSATASIGNLHASSDAESVHVVFRRLYFLNGLIVSVFSVCLYILMDGFIVMWIGDEYLIGKVTSILIVVNFYLMNSRRIVTIFKNTKGLFYNDRYRPLIEAGLNVCLSILFVKLMGLPGIFLATAICTILVSIWVEPMILYRHCFNQSTLPLFLVLAKYSVATVFSAFLCGLVTSINPLNGILNWITNGLVSVLITVLIFLIVNMKKPEVRYWFHQLVIFVKKILAKT